MIKLTGLVPAAGYANRISPLPCSKEIFPVSFMSNNNAKNPRVISSYLLEQFKNAGLEETYIVIRKGKWDIPEYYGTESYIGLNIAYLVIDPTPGTPHTMDKAYYFIKDKQVLFGFPDIQINHENPFPKLILKLNNSEADLVLGLFKTDKPQKMDMVKTNEHGKLRDIIIKPEATELTYTWLLAVWNPLFTEFLHDFITNIQAIDDIAGNKELYFGDVILEAINNDLNVHSVTFPDTAFIDIGTLEDLKKAIYLNQ